MCTFYGALYCMHIFLFYIVRCILVHGALYTIYTKNLQVSLSSLLKQLLYTNQCFVPSSLLPFSNKPRAGLYARSKRLFSSWSSLRSFAADLVAMLNCGCPGRLSVNSRCTHSQVTLMLVSQVSMEW
uniref:Putative secreted protein n=1 Tax=Ixodes ricinus TaxID=34613 RepID=A0A6B0UQV4_IXORI